MHPQATLATIFQRAVPILYAYAQARPILFSMVLAVSDERVAHSKSSTSTAPIQGLERSLRLAAIEHA